MTDEEPIGEWTIRIWKECKERDGKFSMFFNWCVNNHFEIVQEFQEFDAMMSGD